jgi:hypothetical protein
MKAVRIFSLIIVVLILFCNSAVFAEETTKTEGYASVDIMSSYVWRGQKLSNSWVVQPSVGINYGAYGANIWTNYDSDSTVDEGDGHGEVNETDITLSYIRSLDKFTFGAGYIYYSLTSANDTQEIYLSVGYDTILAPTLTVYYDFDEGNGAFIIASIGHSFEVSNDMSLNLGASASYNINNKVMGTDEDDEDFNNFYNAELSSSIEIPLSKSFTVTPKVAYSFPLSSDAEEAIEKISDDGDKEIFYAGINLTVSF